MCGVVWWERRVGILRGEGASCGEVDKRVKEDRYKHEKGTCALLGNTFLLQHRLAECRSMTMQMND